MDPTRKIALVINGGLEEWHLKNVEQSLKVLGAKGYTTYVVNPVHPEGADVYLSPTFNNIRTLVATIKEQSGQEELVIYTTGHGDQREDEGKLCLAVGDCHGDTFVNELDSIPYLKRVVVMDQCYGGNMRTRFTDDPKTLFISGGSKNETDVCQETAPRFWSDAVPDANADGVISWEERFAYAVEEGVRYSFPQFVKTKDFVEEGRAPFSNSVQTIQNEGDWDQALKSLKPGQYAVVTFSAEWCGYCHEYAPKFDAMAREAKGQYLFLRTENEELANKYGVHAYPTVMIFNHQGIRQVVEERDKVLDAIASFTLSADERSKILRQRIQEGDASEASKALYVYKQIAGDVGAEEGGKGMRLLETVFENPFVDMEVRANAADTYATLALKMEQRRLDDCVERVRKRLHDSSDGRFLARSIYDKLVEKMDASRLGLEAKALREQFVIDEEYETVSPESMGAYSNLIRRVDKTTKIFEGDKLLDGLKSSRPTLQWVFMHLLPVLQEGMTAEQKREVVQNIQPLLSSPSLGLRQQALFSFYAMSDVMTFAELLEGAKLLRKQFSGRDTHIPLLGPPLRFLETTFPNGRDNADLALTAVSVYGRVIQNMDRTFREEFWKEKEERRDRDEEIMAGAYALRRAMHGSESLKETAAETYGSLFIFSLPLEEEKAGLKELKNLIKNPSPSVRNSAVRAYEKYLQSASLEEIKKDAIVLRNLFENRWEENYIRFNAMASYLHIAHRLDGVAFQMGLQGLREALLREPYFVKAGGLDLYSDLLHHADVQVLRQEQDQLASLQRQSPHAMTVSILSMYVALELAGTKYQN